MKDAMMKQQGAATTERVTFIDYLRVVACLMVMAVHSCESFYLGGDGTYIASETDAMWVTLIDSMLRCCVPLFVMASSYLLFPVQMSAETFYRKRALRILPPFLFWLVLYAVIPLYCTDFSFYSTEEIGHNLLSLTFNFVGNAGHLWFVYMLLGLYLVMPIFSPWIEKLSKRGERWFLGLCLLTTIIPYWRYAALQYNGLAEVMGEANWNEFGLFYGVSGFIGYVVLGHYLRKHVATLSWKYTLLVSLPCIALGYAINALGFWDAMPKQFPVSGPIDVAVRMELTWGFCTLGTALLTLGFFLLLRKCQSTGWGYRNIIMPISRASYSMYLMHIFFLCFFCTELRLVMDSTPLIILLTCLFTYVSSFLVSHILRRIPVVGKLF